MNIRSFLAIAVLGACFNSLICAMEAPEQPQTTNPFDAMTLSTDAIDQLYSGTITPQATANRIIDLIGQSARSNEWSKLVNAVINNNIQIALQGLDAELARARNAGNVTLVDSTLARAKRFLKMISLVPALQSATFDPQGKLKQEIDHLQYMVDLENKGIPLYRQ